ncbi:hypothetical protein PGB90_002317 [Kerria lacca]
MSFKQKFKPKLKIFKKKQKEKTDIDSLKAAYCEIRSENIEKFEDFPLSPETLKGLAKYNYVIPTEIQKESIGYSLQGEDILGAAKTGSGKTLAFLIPLLECLYCNKWTQEDGLGALVITPTRELAVQIFKTLNKVGQFHDFSAGLIIGGQNLKFERKRMDKCNIVISTPGRLLQHMDENPLFDCSYLKILILDEADRCLDMGFEKTVNAIIANLPPQRQTLLFSATQTKCVKDLARLSLVHPRYISVHENETYSTPSALIQNYIQCELYDKINFIWSFIKNHRFNKVLIFLSSCKQVKYIYETFCKLKPGISIMALYGSLHQSKRLAVYESFYFPSVNWVVQLDCPESANEYIHRAGRTARYQKAGESLLVLLPSEMKMLEHLEKKRIPIQEIQINIKKLHNIQGSLEGLLARDTHLKESAQRAFVAYIKAVFLMKDKDVFNVSLLDTDAFARSLGLAVSPRIRFLQKRQKMLSKKLEDSREEEKKLVDKIEQMSSDCEDIVCSVTEEKIEQNEIIKHKMTDLRKTTFNFYEENNENDVDDLLRIKRKNHEMDTETTMADITEKLISKKNKKPTTRAAIVKKILKKKILPNKKLFFDEEGQIIVNKGKEYVSEIAREYEKANEAGIDIEMAQKVLREEDKYDKEIFRTKIKQKHKNERKKLKERRTNKKDSDTESDGDDQPDLSWLPNLNERNIDSESQNSEQSEDDESVTNKKKRKHSPVKKTKTYNVLKKRKDDSSKAEINERTIREDEELALQILNLN